MKFAFYLILLTAVSLAFSTTLEDSNTEIKVSDYDLYEPVITTELDDKLEHEIVECDSLLKELKI